MIAPPTASRPTHVPENQIVDLDIYDFPVVEGEYQAALSRFADGAEELV